MLVAVICREMHWTYEEYWAQPAHFIRHITHMMKAEAEERERRNKQSQSN